MQRLLLFLKIYDKMNQMPVNNTLIYIYVYTLKFIIGYCFKVLIKPTLCQLNTKFQVS